MSTVIKVENLSKQYRLGNVGLGSLGADVNRWWHTKVLGNEDPYLKIGQENNREVADTSGYVWALQDINFDVQQGEVLGIIGRNGAGKSTLLKILSRVTGPTTGSIKIKGRVASLLEVGTGFHPELTGRENIFLNGAILGMTKTEIRSKFDEIVNFAGVEKYVDTPVKRYSSGMYVRLAFAVAAHLEPEILIVDEVLAVGDAEFQKKAIGKMKEVSEGGGRTVLFVSHNMSSISNLCSRCLLLKNGKIEFSGNTDKVIDHYLITNKVTFNDLSSLENRKGSGEFRIVNLSLINGRDVKSTIFKLGDFLNIELELKNIKHQQIKNCRLVIGIYNSKDIPMLRFDSKITGHLFNLENEHIIVKCKIKEHLNIRPDSYSINVALFDFERLIDYVPGAIKFEVQDFDYYGTGKSLENRELASVFYKHDWWIE